jgi:thiol:disulfide interchange protein DsbD
LAGALLYISASGDALGGALKLFVLGLGMGLPLILVATGGAALLPKSGPWMVMVKNIIGVLLLGTAIGLLSRVIPGPMTLVLVGLLWGGVGLFLGALEFVYKPPRKRLAQLLGLFLLFYAMACWYGAFSGQGDLLNPLARTPVAASSSQPQTTDDWQTISTPAELDRVLAEAQSSGTALLLDWYADWCISCKVIEHEVLNDANVMERLQGYRLVRFDITASNAEQRALLDRYKLFGPPALMFFGKDGVERADVRVIGEINAKDFAERVAKANDRI